MHTIQRSGWGFGNGSKLNRCLCVCVPKVVCGGVDSVVCVRFGLVGLLNLS